MTAKDKTRQKLLDSMRRTKAAVTNKPAPAAETTNSNVSAKTKPVKNARPESKPIPAKSSKRVQAKTGNQTHDPFQSRGRVWPD